jgi:hypothetical protein
MGKRQQRRWTRRGAHLLAQAQCAVINGNLAQNLAAYSQQIRELPERINRFLERLRARAEQEPEPL